MTKFNQPLLDRFRSVNLLVLVTLLVATAFLSVPPKPALAAQPRVRICHRTRSTTNPYRRIEVSQGRINGHSGHASSPDRVWNSDLANGDGWGDIIPGSDAEGDSFWSDGSGQSSAAKNWSGSSSTGGKSFMLSGGTNVSKCAPMSALRFYEVMKLAGVSDADIATDLEAQAANEDAAIRPSGGWTAANVVEAVGSISITTNNPTSVGSTSATFGLRVANNSGVNNLTVLDNGNVGIRQSSPAARLHVQAGGATTSDNVFRLRNSGDTLNLFNMYGTGQVTMGINSVDASALFQMESTTRGFLFPRMTDAQITSIVAPANGLHVYSTTQNVLAFWDSTSWHKYTHTNL